MNEYYNLKGHFKAEVIDKNGDVVDVYEEHNYIMLPARRVVSEMFTNTLNTGLNYLILGTHGTTNEVPITEENGFSKLRTSLYSEYAYYELNTTQYVYVYSIIKVGSKYYKYLGETGDVEITSQALADTSKFEEISSPYVYKLYVNENVFDGETNIARNSDNSCVISYTTDSGDNLENTTVTYVYELGMTQGNDENPERGISSFTEAGMYINNKLFCMKCFPMKVKDSSTKLRITWKIIF